MPKYPGVYPAVGKRDTTFWIRYRDADGRQVNEKVGSASEGMTERKARDLRTVRTVEVKQQGRRRLEPVTFGEFATEWMEAYPARRGLKESTAEDYRSILRRHLEPEFGRLRIG